MIDAVRPWLGGMACAGLCHERVGRTHLALSGEGPQYAGAHAPHEHAEFGPDALRPRNEFPDGLSDWRVKKRSVGNRTVELAVQPDHQFRKVIVSANY